MRKMARRIRKINIRSRIQGERKNTKLNEKSAVSRYKKMVFGSQVEEVKKKKKCLQLDNVIRAETVKRKNGNQKDLEDGVER